MEQLICIECDCVIEDDCTNYGTPEYPVCIHCNSLAMDQAGGEIKDFVLSGKATRPIHRAWKRYLEDY